MPASYSAAAGTASWDKLLAGPAEHVVSKKVVIKSGAGVLVRGTVLGRVAGAVGAGVAAGAGAAGANTGDGTIGTVTLGDNAKEGTYRIVFIEPATNLGTFIVTDPDGVVVGQGVVGTAFAGPINFTIADGSTDFVAGDGFTVAVAEGTKYLKAISTAADGSDQVDCILATESVDATSADKEAVAIQGGHVKEAALVFGAGFTIANTREALRQKGIHLITVQE